MTEGNFHSDTHARLNVLAGVWDTSITSLNSDGSDGETSTAIDTYTWMANGHFLVHEVDAMMGGHRILSTEIFGVDQRAGDFPSRSYDPDGSTSDFRSRISGRAFNIEGETQCFAGAFSKDGTTMTGEWKQRSGESWLSFVRITLTKRA